MTCAFAVRGALRKLPGVLSVEVSLNQGLAVVKLKPGNTVTPEQCWQTVRKNGFTPKETHVLVTGELTLDGGKPRLRVPGATRPYDLESPAKLVGKTIEIEGTLTPAKDLTTPVPIRVLKQLP